jgi:hypothetical protein
MEYILHTQPFYEYGWTAAALVNDLQRINGIAKIASPFGKYNGSVWKVT